jgi:hypothetical protein
MIVYVIECGGRSCGCEFKQAEKMQESCVEGGEKVEEKIGARK